MLELELLPVTDPSELLVICGAETGGRISSSSSKQVCMQVTVVSPVNGYRLFINKFVGTYTSYYYLPVLYLTVLYISSP